VALPALLCSSYFRLYLFRPAIWRNGELCIWVLWSFRAVFSVLGGAVERKKTHTHTHSRVINDDTNFGRYCGKTRGKTRGKTATHARH
jgi:hypothetical protein